MKLIMSLLVFISLSVNAWGDTHWFETLKHNGSDEDLYRTLYFMPKGGDLHNHNSGSVFSEEWYRIAVAQEDNGYVYYTKVRINNCRAYADTIFPYFLLFRNIEKTEFDALPECEKQEYALLKDLNQEQKTAWMDSIRLDKAGEGRNEFFETHWQRLNALLANPYLRAETLASNAKELAKEGAVYLETQVGIRGARQADGTPISAH
ncbi:MAG: adenosine deaminase, partial [Pseudomonadota bacterium]